MLLGSPRAGLSITFGIPKTVLHPLTLSLPGYIHHGLFRPHFFSFKFSLTSWSSFTHVLHSLGKRPRFDDVKRKRKCEKVHPFSMNFELQN